MAEWWDMDSPDKDCRWGSVAIPWHTFDNNEAVMSLTSVCLIHEIWSRLYPLFFLPSSLLVYVRLHEVWIINWVAKYLSESTVVLSMKGWVGFKIATCILKVWEWLCDIHSKVNQNIYIQKAFAILLSKNAPIVMLSYSEAEKNELENFDFVIRWVGFKSEPKHLQTKNLCYTIV